MEPQIAWYQNVVEVRSEIAAELRGASLGMMPSENAA